MAKPSDLFDRQYEWDDLERFVTSTSPGVRVGVLSGRRRVGKSYLLRRLVREFGGIYHMALEEEPGPALQRFADGLVAQRLHAGQVRFRDWNEAMRAALPPAGVGLAPLGDPAPGRAGAPLLVIDELPYLLAHPAGRELPSVLQSLVDESRSASGWPSYRVIVCGSALSIMSELRAGQRRREHVPSASPEAEIPEQLSGSRPLRGRAELDLMLRPFDFRTSAGLYGIADPTVAFALYAIVGGIPGYRDLLADASPQTMAELDDLLVSTVLNPSHALFGETAYLLREDPRITERALYYSVLAAIAGGATTPSKIAAVLGRAQRSLGHALDVLITAGFVCKDDDVLLQRRPTLTIADPIVRFHELVVNPRLVAFEERRAMQAWRAARETVRAQVFGPAFEEIAREWTLRYACEETLGGPVGEVGRTVVNDRAGRAQHELDVVALAAGGRRGGGAPVVRAIGEVKDSDRPRSGADLARLDRVRALLVARGVEAAGAKLLLFGRAGFDPELQAAADRRSEVELVDIHRLYTGM
ncbi:ATP-binding protein [Frankia sp. Cas4]|uniref:AAA family ATPase n=1 Tax=Frankia sp. Cas4 TaxID=3073927 RepID=UPI002AD3076C|nr:ATP-binding protein [Frankia sp. Cas4]